MKKALVILLALTMVVSMFAVAPMSVAAEEALEIGAVAADYKPEGEAIKTAADFAAMKADGKYYLANDLTIEETYMESFKGTFDGNGKTITTTVSLFEKLNGTLKNLTVTGMVVDNTPATGGYDEAGSPIAHYAADEANTLIENVCNKAAMQSDVRGMGGIVGNGGVAKDVTGYYYVLTLKNCANYGNIATKFAASANYDSGGLVAYFAGARDTAEVQVIFENCVNYGIVNAMGRPGGIAGVVEGSAQFINCENNGAIQAIDNYCGGITGRLGEDKAYIKTYVFENCVNNADIHYSGTKTIQLGSMVGYTGTTGLLHFKNCVNNGNVSATAADANLQVGGLIGSSRDDSGVMAEVDGSLIFENCVNNGSVGVDGDFKDNTRVGGFAGAIFGTLTTKFINCVNNGDVYGTTDTKNVHVGGLMGRSKYNVIVINTINNGKITSARDAGGLIGYMDSGRTAPWEFTMSGNNGEINGGNQVGGLIGYANTSKFGPKMTYCFNTGNVNGTAKYTAGLLGYATASAAEYKYCYIAGKVTSTYPASPIPADNICNYQTEYTFNYDGVDYYFYVPFKAAVTVNGTDVTIDSSSIKTAASGDAVAKGTLYTFNYDGVDYLFYASAAGSVTISEKTVTIGETALNVILLEDLLNIEVYDHRINTFAIMWNDRSLCDMDFSTVVIEEGVAGLDYSYGALEQRSVYTSDSALKEYTKEDFASGKVAYDLNQMIGEDIFRQNLNEKLFIKDAYPTTDSSHAKVALVDGEYENQMFDKDTLTTPPTGDATVYVVIALAVSTVSLAALAVVKKRKEN